MQFEQLGLIEPILKAVKAEGYTTPTPIQEQSIPIVLTGKDLLGCAQTGTGKTAAFAIPILQRLYNENWSSAGYKHIRALILTPTRELASQIGDSFTAYGKHTGLKHDVIFGGVPQHKQVISLRSGTDILIATPGRLLDLMNQGIIYLNYLEVFVLDEADRMLDMGFINDIKKIIKELPTERQTLFFSATMPPKISQLANSLLYKPEKVTVTPVSSTAERVEQGVYYIRKKDKQALLELILKNKEIDRTIVFTQTKHGADRIAKNLKRRGINADALHGDKSQSSREMALANFKSGRMRVLVATDIAARGIDVDALEHVINYDLPNVAETYVHRIGRTGRAGASGIALSFCDHEERAYLKSIHRLTKQEITVLRHPFEEAANMEARSANPDAPKADPRRPKPRNMHKKRYQNDKRDKKKVDF
ncbi:ATP-dependent RNA helicase RhlE [Chitinophaga jiangningensis]|uniref:DEAD-box ATP-dependent RNA helicase RhpA n=1 Tax=Chitinophaga jiangningensis TaxID=1419482 RepID=A0A1M6VS24_9BACT|nr:DEAD/DEAH box helicase [Chitinophaga jiangningensis]SHK84155.1 ATP-dependent RNA helicase RhlE [Chitinophaga jiangningensis]